MQQTFVYGLTAFSRSILSRATLKNGILYREDGSRLLDNNTLVALTLMIAESKVEEKDIMTKVVVNLINQNN